MMRGVAGALFGLWLSACNVASVELAASTIARNQCNSSADCHGGECQSGQCRSRSGSLQTVLFEVTPPADATAGLQFLKLEDSLAASGGSLDLNLDAVSQALGEVRVVDRKCVPEFDLAAAKDGSIPALLTLIPSTSVLGLYSPRTVVQSVLTNELYFGFSLYVPPGQYDIYVEPKHQPNDSCPVPPALLRHQMISGGSLSIKLPEPSTFDVQVSWPPADEALNGWVVEMLDPISGRVISKRAELVLDTSKSEYRASLSYLPVVSGVQGQPAEELIRLSPPEGVTAPSILLARSALGLFAANRGLLTQFTSLPSAVHVQGQVTALATPKPVPAIVTLVATKITGIDPGVLASFVRTVRVGASGDFDLDLLPGTYRVTAMTSTELNAYSSSPQDSKLAAVSLDWVVATSPSVQAGKVIELGQALPVTGQAVSGSTGVATAQVVAVASPAFVQSDVLHQALGEALFVPRASTGTVTGRGDFALSAEAGIFDISVRPLAGSGFGWLVLPNVPVGTLPRTSAGVNLGQQQVPLPVAYQGRVTVPGTPERLSVPGALIRAYVYMSGASYTNDPSKADSVLQVAETRSDENGTFEVLIPASLNSWDANFVE